MEGRTGRDEVRDASATLPTLAAVTGVGLDPADRITPMAMARPLHMPAARLAAARPRPGPEGQISAARPDAGRYISRLSRILPEADELR
ncbi:hypothetical protein GCM10022202_33810 [Microbacterium marinilacus]|uniref:Uncharacterized protein n=1 Tax=Microbacterium marinilacus TaxID=415209 RepID=A0ABP7BVJ1_9MICO